MENRLCFVVKEGVVISYIFQKTIDLLSLRTTCIIEHPKRLKTFRIFGFQFLGFFQQPVHLIKMYENLFEESS